MPRSQPVDAPLVITLRLDDAGRARFDDERRALFPPGRTAVGAHVTLFHSLPGRRYEVVLDDLREVAGRPSFPVAVTGVVGLGRGVAYRLTSPDLDAVHADLRRRWLPELTRQDAQPFRAHVTVQNKVAPDVARRTLHRLRDAFVPFDVTALGLQLWRYDGGPWTSMVEIPFAACSRPPTVGP